MLFCYLIGIICLSLIRVLHIDNDNVIFTLKPAQVESDKCLFHLDQVKRGDTYPGVVVQTKDVGALVIFYDNIRGWINKKQLGSGQVSDPDPRQYFFKGQVVSVHNLLLLAS